MELDTFATMQLDLVADHRRSGVDGSFGIELEK